MKTATRISFVTAAMLMSLTGVCWAQEIRETPGSQCSPAGTWIGQNETYDHEFLITIEPSGTGCFSVVSEGIEITPPWQVSTAWRGTIRKVRDQTFEWWLIAYAGPSQTTDQAAELPDVVGINGEMNMLSCNHFEVNFGPIGVYAWGQIPFHDEPLATWPPSYASYSRVPNVSAYHEPEPE